MVVRDATRRRASLVEARDDLFNARSALCRAEEHGLVAIVDTLRDLIGELEDEDAVSTIGVEEAADDDGSARGNP